MRDVVSDLVLLFEVEVTLLTLVTGCIALALVGYYIVD